MVPTKIRQGDIGTSLRFTIIDQDKKVVNVSGCSISLYIQRSDTVLTKACTILDGINGLVQYTTVADDFSVGDDTYQLTVNVAFPTTGSKFTAIQDFPVYVVPAPL